MFPGNNDAASAGATGSRPVGRGFGGLRARRSTVLALIALLALGACRQKMANQPRYDPLEASDFFADGQSARPRVPGTVARGELTSNPFFDTGKVNGAVADGFPMPVTVQVINRGHERFDIYCSQCHGRVGDGNGMIPARGFRRPPSFHTATLRTATTGHFFDVMTNGFGAMPPYGTMIPPDDRWAIVAYIRALQLSQNATVNDVPANDRAKLDAPAPSAHAPTAPAHGGAH
jgi:mono/diheme cytochrome c family protein